MYCSLGPNKHGAACISAHRSDLRSNLLRHPQVANAAFAPLDGRAVSTHQNAYQSHFSCAYFGTSWPNGHQSLDVLPQQLCYGGGAATVPSLCRWRHCAAGWHTP
jgi:hypothetical protein